MKKLVCGFIGSFMIMFFIWTIIGWINEPNFIENASHYHLNLYAMFKRFDGSDYLNNNFINTFRSMIDNLKKINYNSPLIKGIINSFNKGGYTGSTWTILISAINSLINPLYSIANVTLITGYLLVLVIQFLGITTGLATAIFLFVFEPIFIYV